MDRIDSIMGRWNRNREMEVYLTTYDGAQHLRLHGWLKRNDTLIKSENITDNDDYFGAFMVYITEEILERLKIENEERALFSNLEVMSTESERWDLYKGLPKSKNDKEKLYESIKAFMFSFAIKDQKDLDKFLIEANETSLALFKKNDEFVKDYIKTPEMSKKDKMKDIDLMINAFVEDERYEDCAFLVKIKERITKHYGKISNTNKSV